MLRHEANSGIAAWAQLNCDQRESHLNGHIAVAYGSE